MSHSNLSTTFEPLRVNVLEFFALCLVSTGFLSEILRFPSHPVAFLFGLACLAWLLRFVRPSTVVSTPPASRILLALFSVAVGLSIAFHFGTGPWPFWRKTAAYAASLGTLAVHLLSLYLVLVVASIWLRRLLWRATLRRILLGLLCAYLVLDQTWFGFSMTHLDLDKIRLALTHGFAAQAGIDPQGLWRPFAEAAICGLLAPLASILSFGENTR